MPELPTIGAPPRERADAARNRKRILDAADRLFARSGVAGVSLDAIAAEAGVGKGTLFRRFGSKAGLASALLDERERELQAAVLTGPPPLGPGAPAADRLRAFIASYLELLEHNLELVHVSETAHPGARYDVGAYQFWRLHVSVLLAELDPDLDAEYAAHALLAPLGADLNRALTNQGFGYQRIRDGLTALVERLIGGTPAREP
ncbi:MAG: TetR/AcrR family transcriptional regulator [Micromonosporaceae bacterium]